MKDIVTGLILCAGFMGAAPAALAQGKYPDRPIRLIAPFPPGGTIDVNARIIAPAASKSIGQQIVIDNRSGASGIIGTSEAARAKPDGYTLLINTLPIVTNTLMFSKVPYNVLKDFDFISMLSSTPSFVSVHPSLPARSVRELLKLARARPGEINYASAGIGSNLHIAGELFNYLGKVNMVAIQFKGGGPALVGAISGETSVAFAGVAGGAAHATAGRLRALGVSSLKPSAALPGVPTIDQAGLPGYEFIAWFVLAAPKGTPREAIAALNEHFRKALNAPDTIKRLDADGIDVIGSTAEQATETMESELKKWATVIRERGMKAE
jgi:tripartite-type tricarboxylate transporter receptor subunit TctC